MIWFFIGVSLAMGLLGLRGERARLEYVRSRLQAKKREHWPPATVIVPVKGAEEHVAENLRALAELDYPDSELIVTARAEQDLPPGVPPSARVVLSRAEPGETSEKIQNLLAAVKAARASSEVFAFADSDGRVQPGWLKALVDALDEDNAGASTGYRWHVPQPVDLWSLLRSVWNAVIAGGFGPGANRFAWGGAMAIRRAMFEQCRVPKYWANTISDDYRLAEAVRAAGLRVVFAPGAMVASTDHTGAFEFLDWIRRQMMITRFYAPRLWQVGLAAHVVYCVAMAGAAWMAIGGSRLALGALALQLGLGMWKGANRIRVARMALPAHAAWFQRWGWMHVLLVPLGTWLWLYACAASAFGKTIVWRGYRIPMKRPGSV